MKGKHSAFLSMASLLFLTASWTGVGICIQSAQAAQFRHSDVEAAVKALSNQDQYERKHAAFHLGEMGAEGKDAVPSLIEILQSDPSTTVRGEVSNTLAKIGPAAEPAIPALISFLTSTEEPVERSYAAYALGEIGKRPDVAVPALVEAIKQDDPAVQNQAARALAGFGVDARPAIPTLLQTIKVADKELRDSADYGLSHIPAAPGNVTQLIELLTDELDSSRIAAATSLAGAGSEAVGAIPILISLLDDKNSDVQSSAAKCLGAIGPDAKAALPALKKHKSDISDAGNAIAAIQTRHSTN